MELKALYEDPTKKKSVVVKDKSGNDVVVQQLVCTGVELRHSGLQPEQNFNRRTVVMEGLSEGWLSLGEGENTLTIHTKSDGDVVYDVLLVPGYYCLSTGERIPLTKFAEEESFTAQSAPLAAGEAKKWLQSKGLPLTIKAPDYPGSARMVEVANYEAAKDYRCRLRADLHAKFRGVPGPAGKLVRIGTQFERRDGTTFTAGAEA